MTSLKIEESRLRKAVRLFAEEMKKKLIEKVYEGFEGWDDPGNREQIQIALQHHSIEPEEEEVDIANLAMMLWWQRKKREDEDSV